jgi:micrococcal nuclease
VKQASSTGANALESIDPSMHRRYDSLKFVPALLLASVLSVGAQELVRVKQVVDGDTIILESGERVRLLGINAPEVNNPKKPVEPFGKEAAEFTQRMVEGKLVRLEFDPHVSKQDKYSRIFAYVFLEDGTFLNAEIIRQGYGFAVRNSPSLKYEHEFFQLELEARKKGRGLWALPTKEKR